MNRSSTGRWRWSPDPLGLLVTRQRSPRWRWQLTLPDGRQVRGLAGTRRQAVISAARVRQLYELTADRST